MFALGCIIFRVITGGLPFRSDWEINKYANEMKPIFPERWPSADLGSQLYNVGSLMSSLLAIDPIQRPGASETERRLQRIEDGVEHVDGPDSVVDPFFNVGGECSREASPAGQPMVQPALLFAAKDSRAPSTDRELDEPNNQFQNSLAQQTQLQQHQLQHPPVDQSWQVNCSRETRDEQIRTLYHPMLVSLICRSPYLVQLRSPFSSRTISSSKT
jgi:serine/threonine protein kinase